MFTQFYILIYLKANFDFSKLTSTFLLSATQNSMKTQSRLSYHLAVAGCLLRAKNKTLSMTGEGIMSVTNDLNAKKWPN